MEHPRSTQQCPGCGLTTGSDAAPRRRSMSASAACRARFDELLARERGDLQRMRVHALSVDTWTVQHPGPASDEAARSIGVHLVSLYAQLVLNLPYRQAKRVRAEASGTIDFRWLPAPEQRGALTVLHPLAAERPQDHVRRVREWAHSAWHAWYPHHDQVMSWARRILGQGRVSEPPAQRDLGWYAGARNAVHPSTESGPCAD